LSNILGKGEFGVAIEVKALHIPYECPCPKCKEEQETKEQDNNDKNNNMSNDGVDEKPAVAQVVVDHNNIHERLDVLKAASSPSSHTHSSRHHRRVASRISHAEDVKIPELGDHEDDDDSTLSTQDDEDTCVPDDYFDNDTDGEVTFLRGYMSTHVVRHGRPRYAIKRLRVSELSPETQLEASLDLAVEAKFLASIRHPNIVKMRGTVGTPGSSDFMIVMDCLVLTLTEKMQQWNEEKAGHPRGWLGRVLQKHQRKDAMLQDQLADKLLAMYDIARAMRYLHNHL
jgi:hypothetical protein